MIGFKQFVKVFSAKFSLPTNPRKFSPSKVYRYTVSHCTLREEFAIIYVYVCIIIMKRFTFTSAASTLVLREGWCLMSSSIASPRLVAVSPIWSVPFFFLMAGRYSGEISTPKRWSNGSAFMKTSSPRVLRHSALRMLGREART